jgi:hypothetical protein
MPKSIAMAVKPAAYPDPGISGASLEQAGSAGFFEPLVRSLAGDGALNLVRAKAEVRAALRAGGGLVPPAPLLEDALPPGSVPSVAAGWRHDRLLAEIDQEGFAFAIDRMDEPFFNRRAQRAPRQQNLIDIALVGGRVCIRKRIRSYRMGARRWGDRRVPASEWAQRSFWVSLGLFMYSEAAALLRLSDLPFVPKLRAIDLPGRTLYLDYVPGENLRSLAARGGLAVHDADIKDDPHLCGVPARDLERREVQLLDRAGIGDFRREIAEMAREINARGVAPLDIKLGNFIRGASSGRLYWLDFELSRLRSQPRWDADLAAQRRTLEQLFDLAAHGHTVV